MAWGAVLAVARVEFRRRWRGLAALGLLFGLMGGAVIATACLAHRTETAYPRLVTAVHRADATTMVSGHRDNLVAQVTALPGVTSSWAPSYWVGQVHGNTLNYTGFMGGPNHPADLVRPVVLNGRMPSDDSIDEVLLSEDYAHTFQLRVGSQLPLTLLTGEQVARFGVGFGEPSGPDLLLRVVGIGRMPLWDGDTAPGIASPTFDARYGATAAGRVIFLRLAPGEQARREFARSFDELAAANPTPPELAELGPLRVSYPAAEEEPLVAPARRVLVIGLVVAAGIAGAAGLLVLAQALVRHHLAGADSQRIEAALGMTRLERTAARTLPAVPGALIAGVMGVGAGLGAGGLQPLGALQRFEPTPGYLPNLGITVAGGTALAVLFLALTAVTAATTLRGSAVVGAEVRRGSRIPVVWRSPGLLAGLRLAIRGGHPRGRATVATALGVAAGFTVVVATVTFGLSLDRLVDTPSRYGWSADFTLVDAKDPDIARLVADQRVVALDVVAVGTVRVGTEWIQAYAHEHRKGVLSSTVISGRLPRTAGEVAVGPQFATRLRLAVNHHLVVTRPRSTPAMLRIVGTVTTPPQSANERLGSSVVLHPDALATLAPTPPWRVAQVQAAPGQADALATDLEQRLEIYRQEPPREIITLRDLRHLPGILAVVVAAGVAAGMVHAMRTARRRTVRQFAILRAVGFTSRQTGTALMAMAATLVLPALLIGVPVGLGVGRLVWWEVATATGVAGDVLVPATLLVIVTAVVLLGTLVIAMAGRRRMPRTTASVLRVE